MRAVITGGGTGGHIYPAIAIADKIKAENPDAEILFVGTERGLESRLVPKNGYEIKFIKASGFNRKNLLKNINVVRDVFAGAKEVKHILKEFKPDIVVGTGGYVSGPVVYMAHRLGIRAFIHEQNAFPGMTNKILERYVDKVFVGFEDAKRFFKNENKIVITGNPVRQSFFCSMENQSLKEFFPQDESFVILCFGGSRGANRINEVMMEMVENLNGIEGISLNFITGEIHYEGIMLELLKRKFENKGNIRFKKYVDNMNEYIGAADLVISRAGALTISEITVCGKAAILVPSPNVTGNHQYFNAKALADKGGAELIEEKNLSAEKIMNIISKMKSDKAYKSNMEKASRSMAPVEAIDKIYSEISK